MEHETPSASDVETTTTATTASHGVKRRLSANTACERCHARKTRCDGNWPCYFCNSRALACIYSTEPPPKRKRTSKSATAVDKPAPPTDGDEPALTLKLTGNDELDEVYHPSPLLQEVAMVSTFARNYYIDVYSRNVMRCNPVIGPATSIRLSTPKGREKLSFPVALALAARAVGHMAVATELFKQCHARAAEFVDENAASGLLLMGVYQWGEDNTLARNFFRLSRTVARRSSDERAPRVINMLLSGKMLEQPDRPFIGQRLQSVHPFPSLLTQLDIVKDVMEVTSHPFLEEVLDKARAWPIQSTFMDYFCRVRLVGRFPLHDRTDDLMSLDRAMMLLECIAHNDDTVRMARHMFASQNSTPFEFRHIVLTTHVALSGLRCLLCAMSGLVELGSYFARECIQSLEEISSSHRGFSHNHIAVAVLSCATFICLYKRNPFDQSADYRTVLLRLLTVTMGLREQFKVMRDITTALEAEKADDIFVAPPLMVAIPGELLPDEAWLNARFPPVEDILEELKKYDRVAAPPLLDDFTLTPRGQALLNDGVLTSPMGDLTTAAGALFGGQSTDVFAPTDPMQLSIVPMYTTPTSVVAAPSAPRPPAPGASWSMADFWPTPRPRASTGFPST